MFFFFLGILVLQLKSLPLKVSSLTAGLMLAAYCEGENLAVTPIGHVLNHNQSAVIVVIFTTACQTQGAYRSVAFTETGTRLCFVPQHQRSS